jgi:predicted Zn-dependent protease
VSLAFSTSTLVTVLTLAIFMPSSTAQDRALPELAERAQAAMADKKYEEAASLFERLVRARPTDPGLRMNLGMALAMSGRPREALEPLRAAVRARPSLLPAQMFLGMVHLELGEPEKAIAPLRTVIAREPANVSARQGLAQALLAMERFDEAATHFERLSELEPRSPRAWAGLGQSYEGWAQKTFAEMQQQAPDSPYVSLLVAEVLSADGQDGRALALYREGEKQLPRLSGIHEAIAALYERADRNDWADAERRKASAAALDCAAHPEECEFMEGDFQKAVAATKGRETLGAKYWRTRALNELAGLAFARLERLGPSLDLHLVRAEVLSGQGRDLEAIDELKEALAKAPGDPAVERELAIAYVRARNHAEALPLVERLLGANAGDPELQYLLGEILVQVQQVDRAIPLLEKAVAARPELLEARAALGRAYALKGEARMALPHLEAARATDHDGSLHYQLAQAYQRMGQTEKARAALERSKALKADAEPAERRDPPQLTPP